ncbi:MAG TPA: hypothetical protein VFU15_04675 [Bacteroidia bacterium]|nr:hypothetical protein [Bacteroidia bacterium]
MSALLEVVISLAFIYLIFSIIVSGIIELWQMFTQRRGAFLYKALNDIYNDPLNKDFMFLVLSHPLVDRLRETDKTYPHYIGGEIFSDALIDVVRSHYRLPEYTFDKKEKKFLVNMPSLTPQRDGGGKKIVDEFLEGVDALKESDLKQLLRTFAFGVEDYAGLKKNIMSWFSQYMNATSTWYKKGITRALLIVATVITVSFNIDAIHITKQLFRDKRLRDVIVQKADSYVQNKAGRDSVYSSMPDSTMAQNVKKQVTKIRDAYTEAGLLDLPIGWPRPEGQNLFLMFFGWIISVSALGYGADNWFNLLVRLINIRTSVKPKEK